MITNIYKIHLIQIQKIIYFICIKYGFFVKFRFILLNSQKNNFLIDGYCAKYIIKDYQKTPGRKIIENLNLPDELDKIYLVGKKVINKSII